MKFKTLLGAALLASSMLVANAAEAAKTLVYCSEGSPENFTPSINTTGTSFDAARPVYNRLVQFKPGTTEVEPALAKSCACNRIVPSHGLSRLTRPPSTSAL